MKKLLSLIWFFLWFISYDNTTRVLESTQEPQFGVAKLALIVPANIPDYLVRKVEYSITGDGIENEITGNMTLEENIARATIQDIPAGTQRRFEINAIGDESILTYSGVGMGNVEHNSTSRVEIALSRKTGQLSLGGRFPGNTRRIEFKVTAPDIQDTIVSDQAIDAWENDYYINDIPSGTNRTVQILAYDATKDDVTARGSITVSILPDIWNRVEFSVSSGSGSVDLVANFPE